MADNPAEDATAGPVGEEISVETAWHNLMKRIAYTTPALVQNGHTLLNGVDRITGLKSR